MDLSFYGNIASLICLSALLITGGYNINKYLKSKIRDLDGFIERSEFWSKEYVNLATNPAKRAEISLYLTTYNHKLKNLELIATLGRYFAFLVTGISILLTFINYLINGFSFVNFTTVAIPILTLLMIIGAIQYWYTSASLINIAKGFEKGILNTIGNKIHGYMCEQCNEDCSHQNKK